VFDRSVSVRALLSIPRGYSWVSVKPAAGRELRRRRLCSCAMIFVWGVLTVSILVVVAVVMFLDQK
jgi:hypothetical protein